jgi:PAS domain S-box-containing protein
MLNMNSFLGLMSNAGQMLVLCVVYDTFNIYRITNSKLRDTRWVLLSLCGLFFGLVPTSIAVLIAGSFRLYQGGAGGIAGTAVIVSTACTGLCWRYWLTRRSKHLGWLHLYIFGVAVQFAFLSCMFILPPQLRNSIFKNVGPSVLIIYPILTVIIGLILLKQEQRRKVDDELKAINDELKIETERRRILFDQSPYGIIILDPQTAGFKEFNTKAHTQLGYSSEEFAQLTIPDIEALESREETKTRIEEVVRNGTVDFETIQRTKTGELKNIHVTAQVININGNPIYHCVWRDITERKRAEEALCEKEQYLQTIIDASPECIKLLARDGSLLMMNRSGLNMIGAESLEQVQGQRISCLVSERDRPAFEVLTERVFNGESCTLEFEAIGLHGRHIWLETHAVPFRNSEKQITALLGLTRDITERKRAEDAERSSEERFRTLVECSVDVTFVLDPAGNFQFVSPSWETHFGYPASTVIGNNFVPFVHPDDVQPCVEFLQKVLVTRRSATSPCYRVKTSTGGWKPFIANGTTFIDATGNLLFLGVGRDQTAQIQAEEERIALEKQLLHAQKLESLGVLAGGIAHDFNNLLMAIMGNADLALMRLSKESPAVENLRKIEQASARAADLAKQMLAYSGKGKFVVEPLDLNKLAEEMWHMLEVSISKKVVLRLNPYHPLPAVEADATQIRQIIMNLVINASEAIGDKSGVITVTTGCAEFSEAYLQGAWLTDPITEGLYVYLEIADTGCGMDKETLGKIFDPFFTTKFTGRGLGMAAVLGIVRGHKGAILVYSELNKGTTFKILLPASKRPVELLNGDSSHDDWRGEGTVLLVDDEGTVRDIGSEMLKELGFEVITANDGREALDRYREHPGIDLAILDLTMPHMDGEQCFRELRQLNPEVKVIMSSGFSVHEVTQKFAGKGLAGFIQKPYNMSALKQAIQNI